MQTRYNPVETRKSGEFKISNSEVSERGKRILAFLLRDKIYTDKVLAVVREYYANALDEHRKNGVDRKITVGLTANEFLVRDYAKGLSDEDVRTVFGMIGETRKDDDDIGGLGIGSKAGYAYSDAFFVDSYFNGHKTTYQFFLDQPEVEGEPPSGKIAELSHGVSNEPSGICVRVPIRYDDVQRFADHIEYVCGFTPDEVEVVGDIARSPELQSYEINGVKIYPKCSRDYQEVCFIQGGIPYSANINNSTVDEKYVRVLDKMEGAAIEFEMNSFDFSPSRETVEWTGRSMRSVTEVAKKIHSYAIELSERLLEKDLFFLGRFRKFYPLPMKLAACVSKDFRKYSKSSNSIHVYCDYFHKSYHDEIIRSRYYGETIKIKRKTDRIYYALKSAARKASRKVQYAFEIGAERVLIANDIHDLIDNGNKGILEYLVNVSDLKPPRKKQKRVKRDKISYVGNIEKAKYYIVSNYGKFTLFGTEHNIKNGIPYSLAGIDFEEKVVIVPKSSVKKIEKMGLIKWNDKARVVRKALKRVQAKAELNRTKRCMFGSLWAYHKGLTDNFGDSQYSTNKIGIKIKKRLSETLPLAYYALMGGGSKEAYDYIVESGRSNEIFGGI